MCFLDREKGDVSGFGSMRAEFSDLLEQHGIPAHDFNFYDMFITPTAFTRHCLNKVANAYGHWSKTAQIQCPKSLCLDPLWLVTFSDHPYP
jgi:hypothetical protein